MKKKKNPFEIVFSVFEIYNLSFQDSYHFLVSKTKKFKTVFKTVILKIVYKKVFNFQIFKNKKEFLKSVSNRLQHFHQLGTKGSKKPIINSKRKTITCNESYKGICKFIYLLVNIIGPESSLCFLVRIRRQQRRFLIPSLINILNSN